MSFDDWHKETDSLCPRRAYTAGAASRQAEIDELQEMYEKQGLYAFELQKRIDDALRLVQKDYIEYGVSDYLEKAMEILKGEN